MSILETTLGQALRRLWAGELGAVEYARAMPAHQRETAHLNALITLDEEQLAAAALRERQRADGGEPGTLGGETSAGDAAGRTGGGAP